MDSSLKRKETLKILLIVYAGSILTGNTMVGLFGALIYVFVMGYTVPFDKPEE
jgi:hypothetical protein